MHSASASIRRIEALDVRTLWQSVRRQSVALWLIQVYVLFEYVRPQSIYEGLAILPWSQISLAGAVIACMVEGRYKFTAKALWLAVLALTAIIILSSVFAYSPAAAWYDRTVWLNWLLLMLIVGAGIRTRSEFILLLLAYGLWNIKMTQHGVRSWVGIGFAFRDIGVGGAPGWFQNSGEFGIQMCVFLPIAAYYTYGAWPQLGLWGRRFMIAVVGSAIVSMIATSSRGALVGAAAVALWYVWRTPHRVKALLSVAVIASVVWLAVPEGSKDRFRKMGNDDTSTHRLTYWKHGIEIANRFPLLGVGYKNWIPYYRTHFNPTGQQPHNFLIEALAELGYLGFAAVIGIVALSFRTTARVRKLTSINSASPDRLLWSLAHGLDGSLIGFAVSGSFVSVLYYPYLWMNTAMVMALCRVALHGRKTQAKGLR